MEHPAININETFGKMVTPDSELPAELSPEEVAALAEKVIEKRRTIKVQVAKKKTNRADKAGRAALERRRAARGKTIY